MPGLDNKLSNIIGTKLPQWVLKQLETRANKNTQDSRDNDNLLYLANKSAWVRLVSSINVKSELDINYFKRVIGDDVMLDETSLAKNFVLFGGTSKYLDKNSYQLRSGLGKNGAYGILGNSEIQDYGYRPMPGIINATIETQGRLGSVRAATINFKCWDKNQLDIIDALYFKLGFTMFLEWGHTYFYPSPENTQKRDPNKIVSTEFFSIDPFQQGINKEDIQIMISKNSRESEGNYDAMLGIVTNFNFSYNQDGGYDCSIRLMALGVLGDSIRINNSGTLPGLLKEEILKLNNTLIQINNANIQPPSESPLFSVDPSNDILANLVSGLALNIPGVIPEKQFTETDLKTIAFANNNVDSQRADKRIREELNRGGDRIAIFPYTADFKIDSLDKYNSLDKKNFYQLDYYMGRSSRYIIGDLNLVLDQNQTYTNIGIDIPALKERNQKSFPERTPQSFFQIVFNTERGVLNKDASSDRRSFGAGTGDVVYYKYTIQYKNALGKQYFFTIELDTGIYAKDDETGATYDILLSSKQRRDIIENILSNGENVFRSNDLTFSKDIFTEASGWPFFSYQFNLQLKYTYNASFKTPSGNQKNLPVSTNVLIKFNDSSLFTSDITPSNDTAILTPFGKTLKDRDLISQNVNNFINLEDQKKAQDAVDTQIKQALNYQSTLEIMLRTIQLHALNKAINQTDNPDLEIGRTTYVLDISNPKDVVGGKTFLNQIFSTGIFSKFIEKLVKNEIPDIDYTTDKKMIAEQRFQIQSKYGFVSSLMGNKEPINLIQPVNFKELLKAYVVPYQINQEIIKGTNTNHPVYIPLGLLLMILNHSCTIYDTKEDSQFQTPLVYIDFNPEMNFCLTNNKQLSTDPWTCLIPFEGTFEDYKKLFDQDILTKNSTAIEHASGSSEDIPLFDPRTQDFLSGTLPKLKFDTQPLIVPLFDPLSGNFELLSNNAESGNPYRGKIMNILLNIDYLVDRVQQYSYKDGTNSVYLKTFIEQILTDVNKSLGNFNAFRLSYNDSANTFQIVDDQFVPALANEEQVTPKSNTTELPLLGKFSIAKNLEIKSEISSKLSNMLAISANANSTNQATLSTNGDPFGFVNTAYSDRYITNRTEITGSVNKNNDTLKTSAAQFNAAISDFYSKINPSQTSVSHATNYYIDKMARIKNNEYATRAAPMIPVSVNFTTDGISGLAMGQAFTVPDKLLPYTYTTRKIPGAPIDHINNTGFVMIGLTHTIENNSWNTAVKANMIFLKDKTEFVGEVTRVEQRVGSFGINPSSEPANYDSIKATSMISYADKIKIAVPEFRKVGLSDTAIAGALGNLFQESGMNYNAWNIGRTDLNTKKTVIFAGSSKGQQLDSYSPLTLTYQGQDITAYGIAQWVGPRKKNYFSYQLSAGGDSLQTQLKYLIEKELTVGYKNSTLTPLQGIKEGQLALAVNIWLDKFEGVPGVDVTNRISYAKGILEFIKSNNI
jgi:hypothetical protein